MLTGLLQYKFSGRDIESNIEGLLKKLEKSLQPMDFYSVPLFTCSHAYKRMFIWNNKGPLAQDDNSTIQQLLSISTTVVLASFHTAPLLNILLLTLFAIKLSADIQQVQLKAFCGNDSKKGSFENSLTADYKIWMATASKAMLWPTISSNC